MIKDLAIYGSRLSAVGMLAFSSFLPIDHVASRSVSGGHQDTADFCRAKNGCDLGDILDPEAPNGGFGAPIGTNFHRNSEGVNVPDDNPNWPGWPDGQQVSGFYQAPNGRYFVIDTEK